MLFMNLKSYMDANSINGERMAEIIGDVTGAAVRLWMTGARMPTAEIAERIVNVTGGVVTVQDMHEARLAFLVPEKAACMDTILKPVLDAEGEAA